jgi:hypothetical protein
MHPDLRNALTVVASAFIGAFVGTAALIVHGTPCIFPSDEGMMMTALFVYVELLMASGTGLIVGAMAGTFFASLKRYKAL